MNGENEETFEDGDDAFEIGQPVPHGSLQTQLAVIQAKLGFILRNQNDFKKHMMNKNQDTESRLRSLEGYRGMLVGICTTISAIVALLITYFKKS